MIDKNKAPQIFPVYADNGEHSHFRLINIETGVTLWEEPEEGNVPQADSVQPLLAEVLTELLHDAMSLLMNYEQRCEIDWIEDYEELIAKYNEHFS